MFEQIKNDSGENPKPLSILTNTIVAVFSLRVKFGIRFFKEEKR